MSGATNITGPLRPGARHARRPAVAPSLRPPRAPRPALIGAWHAEVKRLSWIQRKAAALLFGGGFLGKGNWDDAQKYLEKAVALSPQNIFHRLELAEVYIDLGKYSRARDELRAVATLPVAGVLDPANKKEAAQLLEDIKGEKDET